MRRERVGQAAEAADVVPATAAPPLWLGPEGDRFEREADRLAGEVAGGGDGPGDGGGGRRRIAHARGAPGGAAVDDAVARQVRAARGRGRPLPARVRVPMERALGAGLGAVRLHTDEAADGLNRRLDAEAFTTGSDIFFRRGGSDLHGPAGHEVLDHELVHVVQQAGGRSADAGSGPGLVQRARGRGGRGGGQGRGRGGGRPPARADKKRARDEPETTDERDAPAAPPWQQYVHHFQLPVPPLVPPGQPQGSTSAPPTKQMKTGSGAAGPPPTTTPPTVPHGAFPDRQPYRHYVTRPVQHPTAQSPAGAQHQRPPYPGPAFLSYPGSPPGSVHPAYPGTPPAWVHPSYPSYPGSVHPSLLGSVPGPAFVSYPGGYPLHQGGVPGPAFVSYPGPHDVVMSGVPTSLKRPLDQDGGPPTKKAKTIHVSSLDRAGMIRFLSTDLVEGQAPKRIAVGVVVWNINHLSKDDRQADATGDSGRRRVATKRSPLGYSSEGLTTAMGNLQKTLAAATPALVTVVDQLLEGYDEEKAAKAKGEKGNKARTDVSQHRSDLVELRALDLPEVLTPGLRAMLAWRNDDGTSTVEQRAGWLADIRALHRVWRRIKRIEAMLVKGNPKLAEKKAAQQQLRAAAGVHTIALGAELKTLLAGLPLADLQTAIGNLKRSTVVDLATDNFFRHKAINLVLINEMNLGIDALRQRAAGSQGRFGVSSGPVMLAKAKVDDDAPAGGKAAKTGFPVTTSDGGKGFATGKQYEYYPAAHKTEGPDALGSRGTFYVRTDGRFVVQGESDNTVLPWNKAEETFRGIVVHRLVQNGQELWAGILHTTPAGHDLDRRDIWPQIRVALDELNQVARHYQVPLLVGGDFYIPAEGIIDDPTDAQSKAIREQDPLLVDRVKLTNIARNIFLQAWEQGTVADLIANVPAVPVVPEPGGPEPAPPGPTGDAGPVPAPPEGLPAEESKVWERYWQRIVPHLPTLLSGFHAETAAGTLAPGLMDPPLNWHQTRAGGDIKKIDIIRNARKVPGLDKADQPRLTMQRALKPLGYRVVASGTATNPKERGKRENKMQLADLFLVNEHWQTALSGIVSPDGGQLKRVDDKALTATRTYWKISDHSPAAMVAATHADDDRPYQAFTLEEDAAGVARKANLRNWDEFAKRVAGLPLTSEPPSLAERLQAIRAIVDRPLLRPDPAMETTVRLHVAALAAVAGIPTKPDQGAALAEMAKWRPFYAVDIAEDEPHLLAAPTTTTGPTPGDGAPPQVVAPGGSTPPAVLPTVPPTPGVVGSSPPASTPASTPAPARMSLSWLLTSDTATGGTPTVPGFPFHDPGLTPPAQSYLTAPKYGPPPTQPAKQTTTSSTITPPTVSPPGASGGQGFAFTPIPGLTPTTPTGPAPGSGATTGTFRFDLAKPPVLGGTGTTFVPPQLPLPVPVATVPTGEVEHVAASCYISALLHVFASHPAYQELLDPQQPVSPQAVGFRTASGLRHLVAKLRNPALRVTQAEVTALIQFLDPLDDLLMGEGGRARQLLYFQHQWTGQIFTQKASAYAVQQDAAEILAKLLDRLQPGARTTATVRSSLTGSAVVPDSVKDEPYRIIDLPIVGGVTSVQGALERFSQPERAADDWTGRTKQLRFSALPEVLTIALKRFHRNAYGLTQKVTTPVLANDPLVIPEVCLVPELKAGNAPPPTYDLVQVTHHEGTLTGGHYTSYGKLTTGGWYKHDDTDPAKRTMPSDWATASALLSGYIYVYVKR